MNKVLCNLYKKLLIVLSLALIFTFLPFIQSVNAVGEYEISTQDQLKEWLQDTNSIQTNNPNAILTSDITLNWSGAAPNNAVINDNSVLDGKNYSIHIDGGNDTIGSGSNKSSFLGLFVTTIYGTLTNVNFDMVNNRDIEISSDTASQNDKVFTGFISAQIINGNVLNCNISINKNLYFTSGGTWSSNTDVSSNHFGIVAGWLEGASLIKNTSVIQQAGTLIKVTTENRADNFMRIGLIASDSYKNDQGTPQITNVVLERWGNLELRNRNWNNNGNCIYGIVVADMSTVSENDANHAVNINGVIYNGVGGSVTNQITYEKDIGGSNWHHVYFVGRIGDNNPHGNYTIENVYSYVEFSDVSLLQEDAGVSIIPSGYTFAFDSNEEGVVVVNRSGEPNEFIWSINQNTSSNIIYCYDQISNNVKISKFNTDRSIGQESLQIDLGQKVEISTFGFEATEVTYKGEEFKPIFTINGEVINSGFEVVCENNLNSTVTNGEQATCDLVYSENPNGIFLHNNKYYVAKENIDFTNATMTILQKDLNLTFTAGNIYTNTFEISGLVKEEKITINGTEYSNGSYVLDCVNNNTEKTISFGDGIIETNYSINRVGFEGYQFNINPFTVSVDEGITITDLDNSLAKFEDNVLTIYSKDFKTLKLNFSQPEGMLNQVVLENSNEKTFDITNVLTEEVMYYTINQVQDNDYQYLTNISLKESLKKVALKIDIQGKDKISSLSIGDNKELVKFGSYYVCSADYNEEITIKVDLSAEFTESYQVQFLVNNEEQITSDNILTLNAKGNEFNIMNITINIISK